MKRREKDEALCRKEEGAYVTQLQTETEPLRRHDKELEQLRDRPLPMR